MMWLYVLSRITEVVGFFGDVERAAAIHELLLPYADRFAAVSIAACRGSAARPLGQPRTHHGDPDELGVDGLFLV